VIYRLRAHAPGKRRCINFFPCPDFSTSDERADLIRCRLWPDSDDESTSSVTSKLDKATSVNRSPIRRRAELSPWRRQYVRSRGSSSRDSRPPSNAATRYRRAVSPIGSGAGGLPSDENEESDTDRRIREGRDLLRDALQLDRPSRRLNVPQLPRESSLRFEISSSGRPSNFEARALLPRDRHLYDNHYVGPTYSLNHYRLTRVAPDGPLLDSTDDTALTPNFAPARRSTNPELRVNNTNEDGPQSLAPTDGDLPDLEIPPPDSWLSSYPPLRRVGHLSPRPYLSRFDGLGDRQRSPTPPASESNLEEDTWETLLTTMEEDEHQPSADSSFTSSIASASTSRRSESASRSQTAATSISGAEAEQPCDLDEEPPVRPRPWVPTNSLPRVYMAPRHTHPAGAAADRRAEERQRVRHGISTGIRLSELETRAADAEAELAQMQRLIDRLSRREDIPDEWWAAAGLSRTIRENGAVRERAPE